MAKRSHQLSDNMDMLLDTMCNLFAGIIVIVIMLVIQTNMAKPVAPPVVTDPVKYEELQQKELESLTSQIMQIRALLGSTSNVVVEANAREAMARIEAAKKEIENKLKQIELSREQVENRKIEHAKITEEILRLQKQLTSLARKEREVRVPMAHKTSKTPVFAAVQGGHLYAITDISQAYSHGASRAYNTTSVEVKADPVASSITILLRPQAGQAMRQGSETGGALLKMLENIDKSEEFIYFAVYPNSYAEFNYIKGLLVKRGIDYNWFPMEADSSIVIFASDSATAL